MLCGLDNIAGTEVVRPSGWCIGSMAVAAVVCGVRHEEVSRVCAVGSGGDSGAAPPNSCSRGANAVIRGWHVPPTSGTIVNDTAGHWVYKVRLIRSNGGPRPSANGRHRELRAKIVGLPKSAGLDVWPLRSVPLQGLRRTHRIAVLTESGHTK